MQNKNMQTLLAQAQKKQRDYEKAVQEIEETEYEIEKNGIVKITMLGTYEITEIKIDQDALSPEDKEFIEESIQMAINAIVKSIKKDLEEAHAKTLGNM